MGLVLLRHGQSEWNLQNRFTGWTDVSLTREGIYEAHQAGQLLKQLGFRFDLAFTSVLKRAIKTLWIVLDEMDQMWLPVTCSWCLNERHYGALQGYNKAEMADLLGEERVFDWRRTFKARPPQLDAFDPRHPRFDPRYAGLPFEDLPCSESLEDTLVRVRPYWENTILPHLMQGRSVLVVAHGNSLRALIKYLDHIPDEKIIDLQIPTGVPLHYTVDERGQLVSNGYLMNQA